MRLAANLGQPLRMVNRRQGSLPLCSQLFGVIDLVPSDVVAAFLLVAALQRANRGTALKSVLSDALLREEGVSAESLARPSQQSPAAALDSGEQPYAVCAVPCTSGNRMSTREENAHSSGD